MFEAFESRDSRERELTFSIVSGRWRHAGGTRAGSRPAFKADVCQLRRRCASVTREGSRRGLDRSSLYRTRGRSTGGCPLIAMGYAGGPLNHYYLGYNITRSLLDFRVCTVSVSTSENKKKNKKENRPPSPQKKDNPPHPPPPPKKNPKKQKTNKQTNKNPSMTMTLCSMVSTTTTQ